MQNRRLLFSVIIKLLTFVGLLLLVFVFLNSLFITDRTVPSTSNNELPIIMLGVDEMQKGQIIRNRWNNRDVAILLRQFPDRLVQQVKVNLQEDIHPSILQQARSRKIEYFVYFDAGDSGNCPLFYGGGIFKDVCSSNKFDEAGRGVEETPLSYMLEIPPHYFESGKLIIGKWQP